MNVLAFDPGYSSIKIVGTEGYRILQSAISLSQGNTSSSMAGLRKVQLPLKIQTASGAFFVGEGAHAQGRPIENLDLDRLTGSPEMEALFLGAMSRYGVPRDPIQLIVGLPIASLMGDQATATQRQVRRFFKGQHDWQADGVDKTLTVEDVGITSQPVGAMFDYLLDGSGQMPPDRRLAFKGELGILSIGMNTVELLVVRGGAPVQRFIGGRTLGVRRLLEMLNDDGLYSLAEMEEQLRSASLSLETYLPVWQREVLGFVERQWGTVFRRFGCIVVVGGGSLLLKDALMTRFKERAFIPNDPVIATARGLYKYALMKEGRRRNRG